MVFNPSVDLWRDLSFHTVLKPFISALSFSVVIKIYLLMLFYKFKVLAFCLFSHFSEICSPHMAAALQKIPQNMMDFCRPTTTTGNTISFQNPASLVVSTVCRQQPLDTSLQISRFFFNLSGIIMGFHGKLCYTIQIHCRVCNHIFIKSDN